MSGQGPGPSQILLPGPGNDRGKVVNVLGEINDVSSAPLGTPMAATVELGDGNARGRECCSYVAIESAVRGIAVHHDQGQASIALGAIVLDMERAPGTLQRRF